MAHDRDLAIASDGIARPPYLHAPNYFSLLHNYPTQVLHLSFCGQGVGVAFASASEKREGGQPASDIAFLSLSLRG